MIWSKCEDDKTKTLNLTIRLLTTPHLNCLPRHRLRINFFMQIFPIVFEMFEKKMVIKITCHRWSGGVWVRILVGDFQKAETSREKKASFQLRVTRREKDMPVSSCSRWPSQKLHQVDCKSKIFAATGQTNKMCLIPRIQLVGRAWNTYFHRTCQLRNWNKKYARNKQKTQIKKKARIFATLLL